MPYKIEQIEGIGPKKAELFARGGIKTTDDLLDRCCDPKGRKSISSLTTISERDLLKFANLADLMRVSGIGEEYSELLEAAGVDTVKELRTRRADNLAAKLKEVNEQKKLTRTVPNEAAVQRMIDGAKELDPRVTH